MSEDQDSSLEPPGKRTPRMRVCGGGDARAGGFSGWTPTLRAAPHARGAGRDKPAGRPACAAGVESGVTVLCFLLRHKCRPAPGCRVVRDLAPHFSRYGTLPRPAVRDELRGLGRPPSPSEISQVGASAALGRAQARTPGVTRGAPSFGPDGFAVRASSRLRRSGPARTGRMRDLARPERRGRRPVVRVGVRLE